jgi:hypothetical protein
LKAKVMLEMKCKAHEWLTRGEVREVYHLKFHIMRGGVQEGVHSTKYQTDVRERLKCSDEDARERS